MSLKDYFAEFDIETHQRKVAAGKAAKTAVSGLSKPIDAACHPLSLQSSDSGRDKVADTKSKSLKTDCSDVFLRLVICGQVKGGKNNICITRTGHRFPNAAWGKWRDEAMMGVKEQLKPGFKTIAEPVNVRLTYIAGDKRRRDMPAIIDSIWHVLEKVGVVSDDTLLWVAESSRSYNKDSPRAEIEFLKRHGV